MNHDAGHVPVMLDEVLEYLSPRPGQTVVDGTAGGGGHAVAILTRILPDGKLILLDRDRGALERLKARFGRRGDVRYFHANFCDLDQVLREADRPQVDACLLDLGVSSLQLADADRGFSFDRPGPLDMRYDRSQRMTADGVVNRWPADRLAAALRTFGDQPFARRIARAVVEARPIGGTGQLAEVVASAVPARWRRKQTIHPATRVFQAIRIAVNDELGSLETFIDKVFRFLRPGGRVVIVSFHSGEDRIVKTRFREAACEGWVRLPVRKPLRPTPEEVRANPRARSARLRVAERLPTAGS
ncbi:MAG: 16S rRNA (cytosine(1402)-N(4))-methyltransferase RsmH [Planctomycetota bacterium]|nr:16S rRNA (cytosine(1402)-N(4))-methyltransferase RsmH [Planctomycetota bacterium]